MIRTDVLAATMDMLENNLESLFTDKAKLAAFIGEMNKQLAKFEDENTRLDFINKVLKRNVYAIMADKARLIAELIHINKKLLSPNEAITALDQGRIDNLLAEMEAK